MIGHNLTKNVRIDPAFINYVAGSTFCYSVVFDMNGYESITGILNIGDVTTGAACPFYAEASTASAGTYVSLYGSTAAFTVAGASGDVWLISEVYRPKKRYVRFVAARATANTVINGGLALRTRAGEAPVAESTSIAGTGWVQDYALCVTGSSS